MGIPFDIHLTYNLCIVKCDPLDTLLQRSLSAEAEDASPAWRDWFQSVADLTWSSEWSSHKSRTIQKQGLDMATAWQMNTQNISWPQINLCLSVFAKKGMMNWWKVAFSWYLVIRVPPSIKSDWQSYLVPQLPVAVFSPSLNMCTLKPTISISHTLPDHSLVLESWGTTASMIVVAILQPSSPVGIMKQLRKEKLVWAVWTEVTYKGWTINEYEWINNE